MKDEGAKKVKGQKQSIKVIQTISACEILNLRPVFKKDNYMLLIGCDRRKFDDIKGT